MIKMFIAPISVGKGFFNLLQTGSQVFLLLLTALVLRAESHHANPQENFAARLTEQWRWKQFSSRSGLPADDVQLLAESEDGTIWAATTADLAWFDGYQWRRWVCGHGLSPKIDRPGIRQLTSFRQDAVLANVDGQVWEVGKQYCRLHGPKGIPTPEVQAIGKALDSHVLVVMSGQDVRLLDLRSKSDRSVEEIQDKVAPRRIAFGSAGSAIAGTSRGMQLFDGARQKWTRVSFGGVLPPPHLAQAALISQLAENAAGDRYVAMAFPEMLAGVWKQTAKDEFRKVPELSGQLVRRLGIAPDGSGLAIFNSRDVWGRGRTTTPGKEASGESWRRLSDVPLWIREAQDFLFDRNGNLWVADAKGVNLLPANSEFWRNLHFPFPDKRNHINSLLKHSSGHLWVGTLSGLVIDKGRGRESIQKAAGVDLRVITGLAETADGSVWVASGASFPGLLRYQQGVWTHWGEEMGLPPSPIHNLYVDQEGSLWALSTNAGREGTPVKSGVFRLAKPAGGGRFERFQIGGPELDQRCYSMLHASDGAIWFGTVRGMFRLQNGQWRQWSEAEGWRGESAFAIAERAAGGIYFGDRRNGLGVIDASDALSYQRTGPGLRQNEIWGLLAVPGGELWAATRGGLFNYRHGTFTLLDASSGLANLELWPIVAGVGEVCVGSDGGGVNCLNRGKISAGPPRLGKLQVEVRENEAEISWRTFDHFQSLAANSGLHRVRLDGRAWGNWSPEAKFAARNLAPGIHTVEVQARDRLGDGDSANYARTTFLVAAPFWQRPVFYLPFAGSLGLVAVLVGLFSLRRMAYMHELAAKEERFRALIEYSSVGIMLRDRNHRVFYTSPASEQILGYRPEELLGGLRAELVHPDDRAVLEQRSRQILEEPDKVLRGRLRMLHRDGSYRWVEVTTRNLLAQPAVGALVTNFRDVTEATEAELNAAEAQRRAELANQAKSDFLAMISHEIRTPINGITGMCHLLLGTRLNQEQREYAAMIDRSAQSLLALINDVLDFSRIEAGKLVVENAPFDLAQLVGDVGSLMRFRAEEKGLAVRVDYPDSVPKRFLGDSLRLRQILINLVGNAIKFTESGQVDLLVEGQPMPGNKWNLVISVRDTGIGISPEKLAVIFDKFTQADASTTRRFGGSGLGLSISRSLAELMGGSIRAESSPGAGSCFALEIPLERADGEAGQDAGLELDRSARNFEPLPIALDVLVVEDNLINQKLAAKLIERLGCRVQVASSGASALRIMADYSFDLIFMDCQMPEMDGFEATALIRQKEMGRRRTPIVALTANAMENDLERCLAAGMDAYLTKPIDVAKLRETLVAFGLPQRR
jgi:PAS domain S-box-containing protein